MREGMSIKEGPRMPAYEVMTSEQRKDVDFVRNMLEVTVTTAIEDIEWCCTHVSSDRVMRGIYVTNLLNMCSLFNYSWMIDRDLRLAEPSKEKEGMSGTAKTMIYFLFRKNRNERLNGVHTIHLREKGVDMEEYNALDPKGKYAVRTQYGLKDYMETYKNALAVLFQCRNAFAHDCAYPAGYTRPRNTSTALSATVAAIGYAWDEMCDALQVPNEREFRWKKDAEMWGNKKPEEMVRKVDNLEFGHLLLDLLAGLEA